MADQLSEELVMRINRAKKLAEQCGLKVNDLEFYISIMDGDKVIVLERNVNYVLWWLEGYAYDMAKS